MLAPLDVYKCRTTRRTKNNFLFFHLFSKTFPFFYNWSKLGHFSKKGILTWVHMIDRGLGSIKSRVMKFCKATGQTVPKIPTNFLIIRPEQ